MTNPYRAMCAELVDAILTPNPYNWEDSLYESANRARTLLDQPDPEDPTDDESFLASIAHCMTFHSRDWGLNHRDAWLYGIVCGWGDALQEVAARHKWDKATVERLQRLRAAAHARRPTPQPPAAGEVAELVEWLRIHVSLLDSGDFPASAAKIARAADLLERLESDNAGLTAAAESLYSDNISLLDN